MLSGLHIKFRKTRHRPFCTEKELFGPFRRKVTAFLEFFFSFTFVHGTCGDRVQQSVTF